MDKLYNVTEAPKSKSAVVTLESSGHFRANLLRWKLGSFLGDRNQLQHGSFFGVRGRSRGPVFLQPVRGRDVDPPQQIVAGRTTCRVG